MLTALRENGKYISLIDSWTRYELENLRQKGERFRCPACKSLLMLKLGEKKSFHFAHVQSSQCLNGIEPETDYHLHGKRDLYEWLRKEGSYVKLEPYLKDINQQPDILVIIDSKTYVIEFQCSKIPQELIEKRTMGYLQAGYEPIWILGASHIRRKTTKTIELTTFQWSFLRQESKPPHTTFILYYCPIKKNFLSATNIIPFSFKAASAHLVVTPLKNQSFLNILKAFHNKRPSSQWISHKQLMRKYMTVYPSIERKNLLMTLYQQGIPPAFYPAQVGIPVYSGFWLETPSIDWQLWILIDSVLPLKKHETITFKQVYQSFIERKRMKYIRVRRLSFVTCSHFSFAVMEYLQVLVKLGVLKKDGGNLFRKNRLLEIPKTLDEAMDMDKQIIHRVEKSFHV